ncbi:hypothetical protein K503DRAFT_682993 [Rhizopogon vinicolor AM-OR11-026]|uniref:Histone deacetylase complex subunit SAP30 Sin3 binding domain-containing protein n=1 Tax=Rhizopogon vinicolor AM-OR11-026 TaxID=1314800 RepID=A0A1B7NCF9_9AGAM|nr:hypothetical protein K503DRAFT_682993 [Rhizopogon vinicolor AM-OR11-026]
MSTAATLSANPGSASGSRSRPQARKKPNDDAAYFGATGMKRQAVERAEGEPRSKRKRVDHGGAMSRKAEKVTADEHFNSAIDFKLMPIAGLYRYLSHFNLVPPIYPSPLTAADPPSPDSLLDPVRQNPRGLSPFAFPTSGNRPRRDPKDQSRRRSSRLLDENESRTPIFADVAEFQAVLATIAERHFQNHAVSEIDTLASFMVKTSTKYE